MRSLLLLVVLAGAVCSSSPAPVSSGSPVVTSPVVVVPASPATTATPNPPGPGTPSQSAAPAPTPAPRPTLDPRTAALVASLNEWCTPPFAPIQAVFPLLGQLADG